MSAALGPQATLFAHSGEAGCAGRGDNQLIRPLSECLLEIDGGWQATVQAWAESPAGWALAGYLAQRQAAGAMIYPAEPFRALALTPLESVRLVILGQDPYHGEGQAEGLAFSVPKGQKLPPSLRNIYAEMARDLGQALPPHGHLGAWARRGVLLLNSSLTVEAGQPASHAGRGWEALTNALIELVAQRQRPIAFLLWGAHAQAKAPLIEAIAPGRHHLLLANHPSPLSARRPPRPFIGCGHFGQVRELIGMDWSLDAD